MIVFGEQLVIHIHQLALSHRRRRLLGWHIVGPLPEVQLAEAHGDSAGGHQNLSLIHIFVRKGIVKVYEDGSEFPIGKGVVLRESDKDVATIITSGIMVDESLKAYEALHTPFRSRKPVYK